MKDDEIKKMVRESYAAVAEKESSCCAPSTSCCGSTEEAKTVSDTIGYNKEKLAELPGEADMGLGCGNPTGYANLKKGEIVLDLGSGGGIDCFIAAKEVGESGKVIGVDMTPEMIDKARRNAEKGNYGNVEFRLGEIDHLPSGDNTIDVILSNCVINLAPDKGDVFAEAYRVLKPGGRFVVSDMVLNGDLPIGVLQSVKAYAGCVSGALQKDMYIETIHEAGFKKVEILETKSFTDDFIQDEQTGQIVTGESGLSKEDVNKLLKTVESVTVIGYKP
jgi:SAM-dependent methyltransferase